MRRSFIISIIGILFLFEISFGINKEWANHIVISEVQISGGPNKTNHDFIELYNPTDSAVDLNNWNLRKKSQNDNSEKGSSVRVFSESKSIPPYGYFLWASSKNNFHLELNADEWSATTLTEDASIALFNKEGNLIDILAWGSNHQSPFIETKAYPKNPKPGHSLERKLNEKQGNGWDTNNNSQDFKESESPTPQNSQSPNQKPSFLINLSKKEEIKKEEIKKEEKINNEKSEEIIIQNINTQEEKNQKQISEKSSITLTEKLSENSQETQSQSQSQQPQQQEEKSQQILSQQPAQIQSEPQQKTQQEITQKKEENLTTISIENEPSSQKKEYPKGIIINEILPNPKGLDLETEYIELKNLNDFEVVLEDWKIKDDSGMKFIISSEDFSTTKISAKSFFILERRITKLALNNSGPEVIKLYHPDNTLVDSVKYNVKIVEDDTAYAKDSKGNWFWTIFATKDQENVIIKPNKKPKAIIFTNKKRAFVNEEIIFDASDSYDFNNDFLTYFWDFGDQTQSSEILVKHKFGKPGKYQVSLRVKDGLETEDLTKSTIEIIKEVEEKTDKTDKKEKNEPYQIEPQVEPQTKLQTEPQTESQIESSKKETISQIPFKKEVIINKDLTEKESFLEIPLSQIRDQQLGTLIKIKGIVSVEPGTLGAQIFYLAGSGIQVFFYKKDFPNLKIGDEIEVIGELTEYKKETRIKINSRENLRILDHKKPPQPKEIKINEINEDLEGNLIIIEGYKGESNSNYFYLNNISPNQIDTTVNKIKIYLKKTANIKKPVINKEERLRIIGIVSQYDNEYRVLPRYQSDIMVLKSENSKPKKEKFLNKSLVKKKTEKEIEKEIILRSSLAKINEPFRNIDYLKLIKILFLSGVPLLIFLIWFLIKKQEIKI